jgi:hypothetical protein
MALLRVLLLGLALLGAQQVALAHAVSHFDGEPKDAGQQRLCELHSAMDAVLGAMDAAPLAAAPAEPGLPQYRAVAAGDPGLAAPTPASRGPPPVSRK